MTMVLAMLSIVDTKMADCCMGLQLLIRLVDSLADKWMMLIVDYDYDDGDGDDDWRT